MLSFILLQLPIPVNELSLFLAFLNYAPASVTFLLTLCNDIFSFLKYFKIHYRDSEIPLENEREMTVMSFGSILIKLRTEKGVYQKELALYLNVSVGTVSNYEKDKHFPDQRSLCKIADFFGVTTDYLLERNNFRYNPDFLNSQFTDTYTLSDFVNTTLELTPQSKSALIDYAELLSLRQKAESSGL